jgi:hypothetical protein
VHVAHMPLPFVGELHPTVVAWAVGVSLALFVLGLVLAPVVVVRIGEDYFARAEGRSAEGPQQRTPAGITLWLARNALGAVLLLLGIAMLVLPGQGVLTILVALGLLSFPGKRRLQRRVLRVGIVRRMVDRIRRRAHKPPLQLD